ncbi:MAG: hypothetical protein K2F77_02230 [Muribaculaceae bacterium]|nr:hypothetical protein [Muribaculaceae bacterium]
MIFLLLPAMLPAQNMQIEGDWTPDESSYLGEIKIKHMGDNRYKIRLNTADGVFTLTGTYSNGEIFGRFEDEPPSYGQFWIGNGPIENGRKKEILVGHDNGSYGTNGAVTGWLGNNTGYHLTNSRRSCATQEKSYCLVSLVFSDGGMRARWAFRGEYLKNGTPMFYQESGWGLSPGVAYTQW